MSIKENSQIKIFQIILLFIGILLLGFGIYATGPRLEQLVINMISVDKKLDESTIKILNGLGDKIIISGVVIILLSLTIRYINRVFNFLITGIQSIELFEKIVSSLGKLISFIYRTATNRKFLWGFLLIFLVTLSLFNAYLSPDGGFHVEGIDLQPPKNLVRHGIYGTLSTEGFDKYTYRISVGPGILLPNALVFKIFGINVYNSRLLFVLFIMAAIVVFYVLARDIFNKESALLAIFFAVFSSEMFLRGIMGADGYIPAITYLIIGALFWFKSIETNKNIYLYLCGFFWGLSFQTQWLFLFAIFAAIVTYVVLYLSKNSIKSKYYLVPSLMVILVSLGWTLFRILNIGLRAEVIHLQDFWVEHGHRALGSGTEEGIVSSLFTFARPITTLVQIDFWGQLQFFLIIPAIIYAIILIGKSKWSDYRSIFTLSFILIWFSWFFFFNYDLVRTHLQTAFLLSQIYVAKLLYDLWTYSSANREGFLYLTKNNETEKATMAYILRVIIICLVLGKILFSLLTKTTETYKNNINLTEHYKQMMHYIENNTERNAVFSGWDWSMPWYVDIDPNVDRLIKNRKNYPPEQRESVPEYFIVSPEWPLFPTLKEWPNVSVDNKYSQEQNEMRKKFLDENCTLIKNFGGANHKWLLYKVNNNNLTHLSRKSAKYKIGA
ncbi:MAG TPA: glycosyltransferase family 39 protein [Ignavibacteriaceae bacterium]|nr:glycosyltransferase family 39 protein [Ignavibacteriaceae bacterium]